MCKLKKLAFFFLFFLFALTKSGVSQTTAHKRIDSLNDLLWKTVFLDFEKAVKIGDETIQLAKGSNYSIGLANTYAKLGVLYDINGKPEKALPYFLNAIKIQEEIRDSAGLSFSYNNLGLMYYAQYNYKEAYKYLTISLAIDKSRNDLKRAAGAMVNLGIINTYLDSLDRSLQLYNEALAIHKSSNDSAGMMTCISNMGSVYYYKKDFKMALNYYLQNEVFLRLSGITEKKSSAYNNLANTYSKLKQFDKALEFAFKDLELCTSNQLINRKQFAYESLNDIYVDMGDYKNAHVYLNKYIALRDSILNEDRNASIAEMQTKYETEKKDKELIRINAEKDKEVQRRLTQRNFMIAVIVVITLLLLIIVLAFRSKQRINKLLNEKNELNEENIKQKEVLIAEVHHRVKNNLQLINSIIDMQSRNYEDEKTITAVKDIQKRVGAIALLHQFLYQKDSIESVEMQQYISELVTGLKNSFKSDDKKIEVVCEVENLRLHINTAVPLGLIINELFTNSFKHAFANKNEGQVKIVLRKFDDLLELEVSDDGVGSNETNSNNFGKLMIRSLSRQLQAEWKVKNENGLKNVFLIKKFK
ncbi:MAG: tetratricopeptide repeat protein [Bacteroidetes bacterium]|nr:tetratricopeptide repeat protein [Bacteroidota bacterium]